MPSPIKAGAILDKTRLLMNDAAGDEYTDTVLLPFLQMAHVDLRLEAEDNNIPFTNITSGIITVPAGVKNIGGSGGPALPADLVEIVEMYERIAGSNTDYMLMGRRYFEPKTDTETTYLQIYTWQGQIVHFIGATSDIEIKIDYISQNIGEINDANTLILVYNSCAFLWFRTAALAAFYIGENKTRSDELNSEAGRCLDLMMNIGIKSQQSMPVRRQPFMSTYRQRGWQGNGR